MAVRTFKERFLRFQLLFPDFYHFHHVIWGMKWAKKLKTKNGQNMSSGPFSHDAAQIKAPLSLLVDIKVVTSHAKMSLAKFAGTAVFVASSRVSHGL